MSPGPGLPADGPSPVDGPRVDAVSARLVDLRRRLQVAGGDGVRVVAVTKGFGVEAVRAAWDAGLTEVGENYAQELVTKAAELAAGPGPASGLCWHFIGRLQRNKVRLLAPHVGLWQSVERAEVGREIARRAPGAAVLVQVNCSGEEHKGGCSWEEAPGLVAALRAEDLDVQGLMGVGPAGPPEAAREPFRRLVSLADDLGLAVRSIGMSADLEVAVEAGSTMVRIGRDLFGPRPARRPGADPIPGSRTSPG